MKKEAKKRIKLELLYPFMHDEKFIYPVSISQELSWRCYGDRIYLTTLFDTYVVHYIYIASLG